jgi:hypothetical protein
MDFERIMQEMRAQYGEALRTMALPPGVEEHLRARVAVGDADEALLMLKLAWIFGAQAGHAAAEQARTTTVSRSRVQA